MKVQAIIEDELAARRAKKAEEQVGPALQEIKEVITDIDHLVSSSIDRLIEKGLDEDRAKGVVFQHLSDLVIAEDIK
jgi:hypothetical protein